MSARAQLRRQMRQRRRRLSPEQREAAALRVADALCAHRLFRNSRHIAFYLPNDGELDLQPLLERAAALGKRCYLPVLSIPFHNHLWFLPYRPGTHLVKNRFGIPEPADQGVRQARKPWALDLVLAPLVAFDAQGNRLGMGGGFYDRTLAFLRIRRHWRKPRVMGVAYAFQRVEQLSAEAWDVPLDGVVTDAGVDDLGPRVSAGPGKRAIGAESD